MKIKLRPGFTLVELLVVVAIIGLLTTVTFIYFSKARQEARDAKRTQDVQEIRTALELYRLSEGRYPATVTPGQPLIGSSTPTVYMKQVPLAPNSIDGDCTTENNTYIYTSLNNGKQYSIQFCLGSSVGALGANLNCARSSGVTSGACN